MSFHSPTEHGNRQTCIPLNLSDLPRKEIENLLKRVASERDNFAAALQKKSKTTHLTESVGALVSPPPHHHAGAIPFDVVAAKKRILQTVITQT
jgi:hypothetical protein